MRASRIIVVAALTVAAALAAPAERAIACTAFAVASDETVCGANLDWPDDLEGYVLVNPRGLEKTFVPWRGLGPVDHEGEPLTWVSRYASITLTGCARDFAEGGMNELGLVIEQASLPSVYPPDDGRPGVSSQQWLQYALDMYRSVGDVVEHLDDVRQDGEGWHFLVVDRSGDWAVIEFLEGSPVVYRAGRHEFPVITNATYEQTESHVALDVRFGGELDVGAGLDSYGRFIRVAKPLRERRLSWLDFSEEPAEPEGLNALGRIDFAFALLEDVSVEDTQRSVVYDTAEMRVHWRSWRHEGSRYVRFTSADRVEGSEVRAVPVHTEQVGDATDLLEPLSDRQNSELLDHVSRLIGGTDDGNQQIE